MSKGVLGFTPMVIQPTTPSVVDNRKLQEALGAAGQPAQSYSVADSFQSPAAQAPTQLGVPPAITPQMLAGILASQQAAQAAQPSTAPSIPGLGASGAPAAPAGPPAPTDPLSIAAQKAQKVSDDLNAKMVPDQKVVPISPSAEKAVEQWKSTMQGLIGAGDAKKINAFIDSNAAGMARLADVVALSATGKANPKGQAHDILYAPVMAALQAAYPSAQFSLVAAAKGSVKGSGLDTDVVIQMSIPGSDKQSKSYSFALHPDAMLGSAGEAKVKSAILASPALSAAFLQTMKIVAPDKVKATAADTLANLGSAAGRLSLTMAVLAMPPDLQKSVYTAMGVSAHGMEMGGLLQDIKLPDAQIVVAADATGILTGKSTGPVNTSVSILGAQDGTKMFKDYGANPQELFAPFFFQAMQGKAIQTLSASGDGVDKFVESQFAKAPDIGKQIRQVMHDAKLSDAKITALPLMINSEDFPTGPQPYTLFRIETPDGPRFVDQDARRYANFNDWRKNNQLPPGAQMTYAKDGELKLGADGKVAIETARTPTSPDTLRKKLVGIGDKYGSHVSMAVSVLGFIPLGGMTGSVVQKAGFALIPYFSGRTYFGLRDRSVHGQTLNPLKDAGSRDNYLMLGSMGFGLIAGKLNGGDMMKSAIMPSGADLEGGAAQAALARNARNAVGEEAAAAVKMPITVKTKAATVFGQLSTLGGAGMIGDMDYQYVHDYSRMTPSEQKMNGAINLGWTAITAGGFARIKVARLHNAIINRAGGRWRMIQGFQKPSERVSVEAPLGAELRSSQMTAEILAGSPKMKVKHLNVTYSATVQKTAVDGTKSVQENVPVKFENGQLILVGLNPGETVLVQSVKMKAFYKGKELESKGSKELMPPVLLKNAQVTTGDYVGQKFEKRDVPLLRTELGNLFMPLTTKKAPGPGIADPVVVAAK